MLITLKRYTGATSRPTLNVFSNATVNWFSTARETPAARGHLDFDWLKVTGDRTAALCLPPANLTRDEIARVFVVRRLLRER